jgi:hypothetical protein
MAIANIKNNWIRRTIIVLGMPLFVVIAGVYGAACLITETVKEAIWVWRRPY